MFSVTPLHLEIVMHYATRGNDMENIAAPATSQYVRELILAGMVESIKNDAGATRSYKTTDRGMVWLDYLLTVPFPKQKWVIESADTDGER